MLISADLMRDRATEYLACFLNTEKQVGHTPVRYSLEFYANAIRSVHSEITVKSVA